jgi:glycosyltransferase involved in cell wall biosynthesis
MTHMFDRGRRALYICYFGVTEPLVQSQVIPYLIELAKAGLELHLVTFEPAESPVRDVSRKGEIERVLRESGITWSFLNYTKSPKFLGTVFDIIKGASWIARTSKTHPYDILHARALVPAVMARMARFIGRLKSKILFDIRGLIIDEYLDAGELSPTNPLLPLMRWLERGTMDASDGFVVLTEAIRRKLFPSEDRNVDGRGRPIERIPCCFDLARFPLVDEEERKRLRTSLGIDDRLVGIYIGSTSGVYMIDEMCAVFARFRSEYPGFFPIILSKGNLDDVRQRLRHNGFEDGAFMLLSVDPAAVGGYLAASDFAVALYKPNFSRLATSPTKNAEYLASGLPILTNVGVGDTEAELTEDRTGVVMADFTDESYGKAVGDIMHLLEEGSVLRERCRESASRRYSLVAVGGPSYRRIYEKLFGTVNS